MHNITPSERKANGNMKKAPQHCVDFLLQYSKSLHVDKLDNQDVFTHLN